MKTPIESTLTLETVSEHFAQWRSRKKQGERTPEFLWREAIELLDHCGISQVTRVLRLSGSDFNKRRRITGSTRRRKVTQTKKTSTATDFAELDRLDVAQAWWPGATAA